MIKPYKNQHFLSSSVHPNSVSKPPTHQPLSSMPRAAPGSLEDSAVEVRMAAMEVMQDMNPGDEEVPRAATSPASREINGDQSRWPFGTTIVTGFIVMLYIYIYYIYIYNMCVWYRNDIWHNYLEIYADADVFEEYGVDAINWKRLQVGYNFTIWPANKSGYVGWFHHESTSLTGRHSLSWW